ncbi:hypothetical protein LCGC14_1481250 [marine sediment metagenome]|uniref:Uncharacterized protein n=1 Tax=marine sediment metagenome TaxID=412755 RepID=A0A0F9JVF0_9ZZZZ
MLLFEGSYIEVGLVDYTDKFLDAMKNWQKYDYAFRERSVKERLEEGYDYIDKNPKWESREQCYNRYLKELDDAKKWDNERKNVERLIQNKLRNLKRVTATVIKPEYMEYRNIQSPITSIELGLKVGPLGFPHYTMEKDVLSIVEYQEGEFDEVKQEKCTEIRWFSGDNTLVAIYLRTINTRPLKLKEWYQKLANTSFW